MVPQFNQFSVSFHSLIEIFEFSPQRVGFGVTYGRLGAEGMSFPKTHLR
jgi:hypothetical protein